MVAGRGVAHSREDTVVHRHVIPILQPPLRRHQLIDSAHRLRGLSLRLWEERQVPVRLRELFLASTGAADELWEMRRNEQLTFVLLLGAYSLGALVPWVLDPDALQRVECVEQKLEDATLFRKSVCGAERMRAPLLDVRARRGGDGAPSGEGRGAPFPGKEAIHGLEHFRKGSPSHDGQHKRMAALSRATQL